MNLFEIDDEIRNLLDNGFNQDCIDMETGEVDEDKFRLVLNQLEIDRNKKIESIASYIMELTAFDKEFSDYIDSVKKRKDSNKKKLESLKNYLAYYMESNEMKKFSCPACSVSFRHSTACNVLDPNKIPAEYKSIVMTEKVDKRALLEDLRQGLVVEGAELQENVSLQIK